MDRSVLAESFLRVSDALSNLIESTGGTFAQRFNELDSLIQREWPDEGCQVADWHEPTALMLDELRAWAERSRGLVGNREQRKLEARRWLQRLEDHSVEFAIHSAIGSTIEAAYVRRLALVSGHDESPTNRPKLEPLKLDLTGNGFEAVEQLERFEQLFRASGEPTEPLQRLTTNSTESARISTNSEESARISTNHEESTEVLQQAITAVLSAEAARLLLAMLKFPVSDKQNSYLQLFEADETAWRRKPIPEHAKSRLTTLRRKLKGASLLKHFDYKAGNKGWRWVKRPSVEFAKK